MKRLRHQVANALYGLASRVDDGVRPGFDLGDFDLGDDRRWHEGDETTHGTWQVHVRDTTVIGGDFKSGQFTYSALRIGTGAETTIFLTRASTRRLLKVVEGLDRLFCRYGESRP
jgi:hypothetical protein